MLVIVIDLYNKHPDGLESAPELQDLMNVVAAKIPSKWRDMGVQLGVDQVCHWDMYSKS